jgi:hypothetical protein
MWQLQSRLPTKALLHLRKGQDNHRHILIGHKLEDLIDDCVGSLTKHIMEVLMSMQKEVSPDLPPQLLLIEMLEQSFTYLCYEHGYYQEQ